MCVAVDRAVPVSIPGLRVLRSTTARLRVGIKEYHAIARVERGRSQYWAQGGVHSSGPGAVMLKRPGDVHRDIAHDGPITFQAVLLRASDFESIDGKVIAEPQFEPHDERALPFHRLHDAIAAGADRFSLEVALTEAVMAFTRLSATPDHTRPVRRAMECLRERMGEAITLDEIARDAGLDKFHLCRAFRAQIGMPPHAYLTHLRIVRAKELLKSGVRASEVAPRVGLYDQSQLNRHFRRIVGTTPARYGAERRRLRATS